MNTEIGHRNWTLRESERSSKRIVKGRKVDGLFTWRVKTDSSKRKKTKLGGLFIDRNRTVFFWMHRLYQVIFTIQQIVHFENRLFKGRSFWGPFTFFPHSSPVIRSLSMILVRFAIRGKYHRWDYSWTKWWILNKFGHFYWFWKLVRGYFLFEWPYFAALPLFKILEQRIPRTILSFRTRGHVWGILRTFLCIINNRRTLCP